MAKIVWIFTLLLSMQACSAGRSSSEGETASAHSQPPLMLRSGPMVGYSTMREVMLWVQTEGPGSVAFAYWPVDAPDQRRQSEPVATEGAHFHTAHVRLVDLQPGTTYAYELLLNGKQVDRAYPLRFQTQPLWQWRREPPAFTLAMGSCAYINDSLYDRPGKPYGGDYRIFQSIHQKKPDCMLWMGDNVYLREADWNSRYGIMYRYSHTRATEALQPLLGSVHHYAIWDDHDFGPNNSNRSFVNKHVTYEAFKRFWANPGYGVQGLPGITYKFQWHDVDVFLLDNRYFRTPPERYGTTRNRTILGKVQMEWLLDALVSSRASFKLVAMGGQFLNTAAKYENYATYPQERQYLIDAIHEERIEGVIFLSGDRHHTELSKLEASGYPPIYDLTISPLTSGAASKDFVAQESNRLRVEGTLVTQRNFGLLRFSGSREARKLDIQVFDTDGRSLWERRITRKAFIK